MKKSILYQSVVFGILVSGACFMSSSSEGMRRGNPLDDLLREHGMASLGSASRALPTTTSHSREKDARPSRGSPARVRAEVPSTSQSRPPAPAKGTPPEAVAAPQKRPSAPTRPPRVTPVVAAPEVKAPRPVRAGSPKREKEIAQESAVTPVAEKPTHRKKHKAPPEEAPQVVRRGETWTRSNILKIFSNAEGGMSLNASDLMNLLQDAEPAKEMPARWEGLDGWVYRKSLSQGFHVLYALLPHRDAVPTTADFSLQESQVGGVYVDATLRHKKTMHFALVPANTSRSSAMHFSVSTSYENHNGHVTQTENRPTPDVQESLTITPLCPTVPTPKTQRPKRLFGGGALDSVAVSPQGFQRELMIDLQGIMDRMMQGFGR